MKNPVSYHGRNMRHYSNSKKMEFCTLYIATTQTNKQKTVLAVFSTEPAKNSSQSPSSIRRDASTPRHNVASSRVHLSLPHVDVFPRTSYTRRGIRRSSQHRCRRRTLSSPRRTWSWSRSSSSRGSSSIRCLTPVIRILSSLDILQHTNPGSEMANVLFSLAEL